MAASIVKKANGRWILPKGSYVEHMTTLDKIPFILGIAHFKKALRGTAIDWCNNQNIRAGLPPVYSEDVPAGLLPRKVPLPTSKNSGIYVYSSDNFKLFSNNLGLIGHKMSLPVILKVRLPEDTPIVCDEYYVPFDSDESVLEKEQTWDTYGSCAILSEDAWHPDDIVEFRYLNFSHQLNVEQQEIFLRSAHLARMDTVLFMPQHFPPLVEEQNILKKQLEDHRIWSRWQEFEEDEVECVLEDVLDSDILMQFWDGISFDTSMRYQEEYFRRLVPQEVKTRVSEAMVYQKVGKMQHYKSGMVHAWKNYLQYR